MRWDRLTYVVGSLAVVALLWPYIGHLLPLWQWIALGAGGSAALVLYWRHVMRRGGDVVSWLSWHHQMFGDGLVERLARVPEKDRAEQMRRLQAALKVARTSLFDEKSLTYCPIPVGDLPLQLRIALIPDFLGFNRKGREYILSLERSYWAEDNRCTVWYYDAVGMAPDLHAFHEKRDALRAIAGFSMAYSHAQRSGAIALFPYASNYGCPYDDELGREITEPHEITRPGLGEPLLLGPEPQVDLPEKLYLELEPGRHLMKGQLYFGEDMTEPGGLWVEISRLTHVLVMGISGMGKSVLLNQVLQGVAYNEELFERVYLVDLKGGVELNEYSDLGEKFRVVYEYEKLLPLVRELVGLVKSRLDWMRENRTKKHPGGYILFVVDEFAQIQLAQARTKEEKQDKDELLAGLNVLSMLGRAAGLVIWTQLQKATTDAMDSSFRTNLQSSICFRVQNKTIAASMFGSTDELKQDPTRLRRGQFIFYDDRAGETYYLQARMMKEKGSIGTDDVAA